MEPPLEDADAGGQAGQDHRTDGRESDGQKTLLRRWQAASDQGMHHPVSTQYRLMRSLSKALPDTVTRAMMS
ncbi:MAG: hypothetical protein R3F47_01995 [Gammaproteobacteria bacterium]